MENQNKAATLRAFVPNFLAELAFTAVMVGVYALLGKLTLKVGLGAALGLAATSLNFLALIFSVLRAEQAETPEKGALLMRGNYLLRTLLLVGALVLALTTDYFDPLATLLPLVFLRVALMIPQKKEAKS